MKKRASLLLTVVLFFAGLFAGAPKVYAAPAEQAKVVIFATCAIQENSVDQAQLLQSKDGEDEFLSVITELYAPENYLVVSKMEECDEFVVKLTINNAPLTAEEFERVSLKVDCGGINFKVTPNEKDSSYSVKLLKTEGLSEQNYKISVITTYTDSIGRMSQSEDSVEITLSSTPLWLKWTIGILVLLVLFLVLWEVLHIRVYPSAKILHNVNTAAFFVGGKEVSSATLQAKRRGRIGRNLEIRVECLGNDFAVIISNLRPGDASYTTTPNLKRSFLIHPNNVKIVGNIHHVNIAGRDFHLDKTGALVPVGFNKPFNLRSNTIIFFDGSIVVKGETKSFRAEIPISFKTARDYLRDLQRALQKNEAGNLTEFTEALQKLNKFAATRRPETPAVSAESNNEPQPEKKYAFISYSTKNQSYADAMRNLFKKHNIDTWMAPYDIPAGSRYAAVITKAIRECSCFVLLLSNDSQASVAVDQEVELAVMEYKKSIITIELEKVVLNDAFIFYIHNKQIIAAHKFDETSRELKQVLDAVKAYTDQ